MEVSVHRSVQMCLRRHCLNKLCGGNKIDLIFKNDLDDKIISPKIRQSDIPAMESNYIHSKIWDEINHPFTNVNG